MTEPKRHDWPVIIAEILEAFRIHHPRRSPLNTLCKMIHREHIQVQRWIDGSEPRHFEGEMLLTIHREYVSREATPVGSPIGQTQN